MSTEDNYYSILELNPNASEADVRKAYRRMALRWHPDKNQANPEEAERRFKLISEAYEVLSDQEKRRIYDFYGKAGLAEAAASGDSQDPDDSADFFRRKQRQQQQQQQQQRQRRQQQSDRRQHGDQQHWQRENMFHFRDPRDLFREFFGPSDPFTRIPNPDANRAFEDMRNLGDWHRASNNIGGANFANFGFFDFGRFSSGYGDGPRNSPSDRSRAGAGGLGEAAASASGRGSSRLAPLHTSRVSQTFTNTVNGRRVIVRKVVENGVETVTETVDGRVTRETVNGQPVIRVGEGDEKPPIRVT